MERVPKSRGLIPDLGGRAKLFLKLLISNDIAVLKGSSSWLTSLPLSVENCALNKREFYDSISIRYRLEIKRMPSMCHYGKQFTLDHEVSCLKGGFIHRRHNDLRNR